MKKIIDFFNKYFIWFLFLIPVIYILTRTVIVDNDIWFILNSGRYVLNKGIPVIEPFTIHHNLSFVMQQWLSAVIYYIIWSKLTKYGLFIFINMIGIIFMFLYYKLLNIVSQNKKLNIIFTCIVFILIRNFITTRPQIFTFIILILELICLEKYIKEQKSEYLYYLPILSFFEINLHSSMWFMQFAFLLPYLINGIFIHFMKKCDGKRYRIKPIIYTMIVMFIVGFINPYGYKAITYIFNSYGIYQINNYVGEMKRIDYDYKCFKIIFLMICFLIIILNYKKNKIDLRYLLLLFGTLLLAYMNYKGIVYFYLIYFIVLINLLKGFKFNFKFRINQTLCKFLKSVFIGVKIALPIMLIITLCYAICVSLINLKYDNYLKDTADFIIKDAADINKVKLYVGYNDGGYMEYRGIKSYIDPRAEVFLKKNNKKEDIFIELYNLDNDDNFNFEEFLNKYDFNYLLVDNGEKFDKYLKNNENYELKFTQYDTDGKTILCHLYKKV